MSKIKIKVSNQGNKNTQYHYLSSCGPLSVGVTKEISINIGDTLTFERDSTKYVISENDKGRTFVFSK